MARTNDSAAALLARVPLFAELDRKELDQLAALMRERVFEPGHEVTSEGRSGLAFFVIVDGKAQVTIGGKERGQLGPGNHFGEIALVTGRERLATVTASTALRCYALMAWEFKPFVLENPTIGWKLLETLGRIVEEAEAAR